MFNTIRALAESAANSLLGKTQPSNASYRPLEGVAVDKTVTPAKTSKTLAAKPSPLIQVSVTPTPRSTLKQQANTSKKITQALAKEFSTSTSATSATSTTPAPDFKKERINISQNNTHGPQLYKLIEQHFETKELVPGKATKDNSFSDSITQALKEKLNDEKQKKLRQLISENRCNSENISSICQELNIRIHITKFQLSHPKTSLKQFPETLVSTEGISEIHLACDNEQHYIPLVSKELYKKLYGESYPEKKETPAPKKDNGQNFFDSKESSRAQARDLHTTGTIATSANVSVAALQLDNKVGRDQTQNCCVNICSNNRCTIL